jgi:leucyl-tRNA synthetase
VVQINGRVRARLRVPADITEETGREAALADDNVQRHLEGRTPRRVIYVPGRLVNVVV